MKKLELKNLKIKKLTSDEKVKLNGGKYGASGASEGNCCMLTSAHPIACVSIGFMCYSG